MTEAEKAYQYFVIAVPESEEQAKAYFWARKALQSTLTPPNEWVSVENALPEECADILLCRKILKIPEIGTYQQARFWVYDEIGDVYQVDDVTHWLPIPTPYDIEHIHISEPPEG